MPVLVRHEVPDGLIQTSLLDLPDINVGSDAQTMFVTINNAIKSAKLSWDYCMTYSSDNTTSMVEKSNSLLTKIKNAKQFGQCIFNVGCPCYLAHLCAEKGEKELSLNIEDMIIDIYYHFHRNVKIKSTLQDYMEFTHTISENL